MMSREQISEKVTPKILTQNGYIKNGFLKIVSASTNENENEIASSCRMNKIDAKRMKRKLLKGLYVLFGKKHVDGRLDMYEILKERGFLPVIAGCKEMSFSRFHHYYMIARKLRGLEKHLGTKKEFIEAHYKTWDVESIADHIGSKPIYVQQTISKIKRQLAKNATPASSKSGIKSAPKN